MKIEMWEILVPTVHRKNGKPIRTRFHRIWDAQVRAISGGLTITPVTKGQWISFAENGKVYEERMIPVRIACTPTQFILILKITRSYYDQLTVMAYRISSEVILYEGED